MATQKKYPSKDFETKVYSGFLWQQSGVILVTGKHFVLKYSCVIILDHKLGLQHRQSKHRGKAELQKVRSAVQSFEYRGQQRTMDDNQWGLG